MKESYLQQRVIQWLRGYGWHSNKIPDMPRSESSRFVPTKPYDLFAYKSPYFVAMELKFLKENYNIENKKIRPNQIDALLDVNKQEKGRGFFLVFFNKTKISKGFIEKFKEKDLALLSLGKNFIVLFIDPVDMGNLKKEGKAITIFELLDIAQFKCVYSKFFKIDLLSYLDILNNK